MKRAAARILHEGTALQPALSTRPGPSDDTQHIALEEEVARMLTTVSAVLSSQRLPRRTTETAPAHGGHSAAPQVASNWSSPLNWHPCRRHLAMLPTDPVTLVSLLACPGKAWHPPCRPSCSFWHCNCCMRSDQIVIASPWQRRTGLHVFEVGLSGSHNPACSEWKGPCGHQALMRAAPAALTPCASAGEPCRLPT